MNSTGLSSATQAYLARKMQNNMNKVVLDIKPNETVEPEEKKGKNKLALALGALGVLGAAVAISVKVSKGKEIPTKTLSEISFTKGIASLPDGTKFSGIVHDIRKNGDNIKLEYVDGIIKNSRVENDTRIIVKTFETLEDGTRKITEKVGDSNAKTFNLETLTGAAKKSQQEYADLIANKESLSAEDFKKQADLIQFKNKQQLEEIDEIIKDKQKPIEVIVNESKQDNNSKRRLNRLRRKEKAEAKAKTEAAVLPEKKITLVERTQTIYEDNNINRHFTKAGISREAYKQLKKLPDDKLATIDDETLKILLQNNGPLVNFDILQDEYTAQDLLKIFSDSKAKIAMRGLLEVGEEIEGTRADFITIINECLKG